MNKYPTVLVHGFLGTGADNGFYKIFRYFGSFTGDLTKELRKRGYEVYQPSLGPFNGMWTRCCELYAYLVGGTVDYGKAHSETWHHERFGRTYPGVLKDWGLPGDHARLNLIGHSFGGPTVCLFSSLLEQGSAEEREATPESELSPLFKGGQGNLLHTVTTVDGTNNGTTVTDFLGNTGRNAAAAVIYGLGVLYNSTKGVKFYDFMNEHYGLMDDPQQGISGKFVNPLKRRAEIKNLVDGEENIMWQMSTEFSRDYARRNYTTIPTTYYFVRRGSKTHDGILGAGTPNRNINPIFMVTAPIISLYRSKKLGIDDSWAKNDGVVPVRGMNAPDGQPAEDYEAGTVIRPGVWFNMPVEEGKDHENFVGMFYNHKKLYQYFDDMLRQYSELPDA